MMLKKGTLTTLAVGLLMFLLSCNSTESVSRKTTGDARVSPAAEGIEMSEEDVKPEP